MTRPIKPHPGFKKYRFFDLVTGKSPRIVSLPPDTARHINKHLKDLGVSFSLYFTKAEQEALDEGSK